MSALFGQFSFPGGVPSHCAPETPGSLHEGGELGYSLLHAYGAVLDNPDLVAFCVVGDGEAETGPLATSWHCNTFVDPVRDGAVLPILHLNGYKIANPTLLARIPEEQLLELMRGNGYDPHVVSGDDPGQVHQRMARYGHLPRRHRALQTEARAGERPVDRKWPMIVLRTPKGWTCPPVVDGQQVEGTFRAHQVPLPSARTNDEHRRVLEAWMLSYRPARAVRRTGPPGARAGRALPSRRQAHEREPVRQRRRPAPGPPAARLARLRRRRRRSRRNCSRGDAGARQLAARRDAAEPGQLLDLRPRRAGQQPAPGHPRRVRAPLAGRRRGVRRAPGPRGPGLRDPLGARLPGAARGLPAHGSARVVHLLRSLHPHRRLDVQPAREVAPGQRRGPVAPTARQPQLPAVLARLAPGPQRLHPPGPRVPRRRDEQGPLDRPGLPAAGREHAAVDVRPLPALAALRQRRGRRQAAAGRLARRRAGGAALRARCRDLGVGQQRRRRRRPRRGARLRRRRTHAGDAGGRLDPARRTCPTCGSGWSTSST